MLQWSKQRKGNLSKMGDMTHVCSAGSFPVLWTGTAKHLSPKQPVPFSAPLSVWTSSSSHLFWKQLCSVKSQVYPSSSSTGPFPMMCLEDHGVIKIKTSLQQFSLYTCVHSRLFLWCGGWIYCWPWREENWRLLMALRISPELPEHSVSNTDSFGMCILPQLCSK